jgi:hypothetical protein
VEPYLKPDLGKYNCSGNNLIKLYQADILRFTELRRQATIKAEQDRLANLIQERYVRIDQVEKDLKREHSKVSFRRSWWKRLLGRNA